MVTADTVCTFCIIVLMFRRKLDTALSSYVAGQTVRCEQ